MPITNGGFETAGSTPELAQGWTSSFVSSLEEWADFAQNPSDGAATTSQDGFERGWTAGDQAFVTEFVGETVDVEAAIFNVGPGQFPIERFELAWGSIGTIYMPQLSSSQPAAFSGHDEERFEEGWGTVDLELPSSAVVAEFESRLMEQFERGWNTDDFTDSLEDFGLDQVLFDGAQWEDFEDAIAPATFTANDTSNIMTLDSPAAVPLVDDQLVYFEPGDDDSEVPGALQAGSLYFLSAVSGDTFKVAPNAGGTALNLTSAGIGTLLVRRDPHHWWSDIMTTV